MTTPMGQMVSEIMYGEALSDAEIDARMARIGYPEWRRWRESDTYMTQMSCKNIGKTKDPLRPMTVVS